MLAFICVYICLRVLCLNLKLCLYVYLCVYLFIIIELILKKRLALTEFFLLLQRKKQLDEERKKWREEVKLETSFLGIVVLIIIYLNLKFI